MVQKEMVNDASSVLFRRLPYMLSPQLDIYERLPQLVRGSNRVLEVGFGTGIGVLQYARAVNHVTAIEIDPAAVRFAQRCFPLENVRWQEADIANDPVQMIDDPFDFIVMIEVLEHVAIARHALKKVSDALRLGSQALITVPNMNRHRRKDEELNVQEWTPETFNLLLLDYFANVKLLQEDLRSELFNRNTSATPIMALCS